MCCNTFSNKICLKKSRKERKKLLVALHVIIRIGNQLRFSLYQCKMEVTFKLLHIIYIQRRQWHPTRVLLPGKSHGWRSLIGSSPWGRYESDD